MTELLYMGKNQKLNVIKSIEELNGILTAWEIDRNIRQKGVNRQFTTEGVRIKLKRL